ncbi:MAG: sigma-54 dependent transcriptional regulator [Bacteroidaceae bacterium]
MGQTLQQVKMRFSIIGNNEQLNRAIDIAVQVAPTDLSVLIMGESGVGKESFPQIVHQYSKRKHGRYIAMNCGAIPEGTIDSELFGHEKGSFTGAISNRNGYFAEADGGTIFLDEVGELPLATQARLLRVLESGEYIKVGSSQVEKTNVRIVAATNVKLLEAIKEGKFREDLYYRLNTVPIIVPALRDRGKDVLLLFRKFALDFSETYRMPAIQLTPKAQEIFMKFRWPGNVRQLKNITEQISIIENERLIDEKILLRYFPKEENPLHLPAVRQGKDYEKRTFDNEREILYQVLFDMRKDMTDLKKLVNDLMVNSSSPLTDKQADYLHRDVIPSRNASDFATLVEEAEPEKSKPKSNVYPHDYQDTAEVIEESLSLSDIECETIRKALERHKGKRKSAAQDLNISERTLYRKIKEYGLE